MNTFDNEIPQKQNPDLPANDNSQVDKRANPSQTNKEHNQQTTPKPGQTKLPIKESTPGNK